MDIDFRFVTEVDHETRQEWTAFIDGNPDGNFFQTPSMLDLIVLTARWEPVVVIGRKGDSIVGVMVGCIQQEHEGWKGRLSARAIVWGGPVVDSSGPDGRDVARGLLSVFVSATRRRCVYLEVRNLFDTERSRDVFEGSGFRFREQLNFLVPTDGGEQEVRSRLSRSKKRQISKSLKAGAEIVEPTCLEEVREFYAILRDLYTQRVRKPLPDWSFFEAFYNLSKQSGLAKYFLVRHEGRIVGGIMCPVFGEKAIYEWYVCGIDRELRDVFPSVLATWAPVEYAVRNRINWFDFMGAGRPDDDYGVREFKSKFGGDLVEFGRYVRINKPVLYQVGKLGVKLMQKGIGLPGG